MSPLFPEPVTVLEPSNTPASDAAQLARAFARDGCVLLRGVLDPTLVTQARHDLTARLAAQGAVADDDGVPIWTGAPVSAIDAFALHQNDPVFVRLAHSRELRAALEDLHGEPVHIYASVQIRHALPHDDRHTIPTHQDARYINPDMDFGAFWIPLVDIPVGRGGLALVPGSHRDGLHEHTVSTDYFSYYMGEERPQRCIPLDDVRGEWATAAFEAGDVLVFDSFEVHTALPNRSDIVRLSIDGRYQLASRPLVNWQSRLTVLEGTELRRRILEVLPDADTIEANLREAVIAEVLARGLPVDSRVVEQVLASLRAER
jgi:ectoine hydroxylase-related dioxygenase (phytanoyl-CoA dioxygenase family)